MGGFNVDGDGKRERRRENGDSQSCAYHRRSKSASDKNMDSSTNGASHSIPKNSNDSLELLSTMRSSGRQSCVHECPRSGSTDAVINHRASLEKDIEQLQLRLQQEKSMRMLLERAMGRASSTLSPGHRHFAAQTKELIAEIELLEEEVANREHYVLSLYRSIFENCVSQPSSERSSVVSSPARTKKETRKHPSIISSAFCSSKFPLRPFRAMGTVNDSGKKNLVLQSKTRHASMFSGKANIHLEKRCSDHSTVQTRLPTMNKTSVIRTLKDHIYQCPSKLSEEMVKCMAAVYCWLRSVNGEQNRSPMLSRSSTNVILPRRGHLEDKEWSCKSMVEISCLSTDKSNFSHAAYAMNNYRVLVEQLEKVNVREMEANAQTAFWINLYNSLVMHAYLAYGISHSSLRRLALFHKAAYKVDGHVVNANAIEQAIFCFRTPRNGRWLETLLSTAKRKRSGEENQEISSKFRLQNFQPLICFALCTGALSDPVLKVYTGSNIKEEIQEAKKEFLESNIVVEKSKKVFLPKLLERFSREASIASDDILNWVIENVDTKLRDLIQKCVECKSKKKMSQIIEWSAYSSRFRYVFSKELAEKPWWA